MSGGHLLLRLGLEWGSQRGRLFGGRSLGDGIDRVLGLVWGLCMSRSLGRRSLCIRSFSITGGPWL